MNIQKNKQGLFFFRGTIPADVSATFKPHEFRFSLQTKNPILARALSIQLQSAMYHLVMYCRQRGTCLSFNSVGRQRTGNLMFDLIASMTVGNTEVTIKSNVGNEASVASVISQVLAGTNNIPQVTPQVATPVVQKLEPPEEPDPDVPERKAIKVIAVYRKYCERAGVTPRTHEADSTAITYMEELFGAKRMCDISRDVAFTVKGNLPNLKSTKVWADGKRRKISGNRAARIFKTIVSFFTWAMRQGNIDFNPFDGMKLDVEVESAKIIPFSFDELKTLFEGEGFLEWVSYMGYRYWLPVIALYTGMRLSEIAQLEVKDVVIDKNGKYFFNITTDSHVKGHVKRVKNEHSIRVVPVSQKIIDLGFDGYLKTIKAEKYSLLFPDIAIEEKTHYTASGYLSLAFSFYRRNTLQNDKDQTFHSLRHNVVTLLKQKKFALADIQEFVGHAHGNITFDIYGEPQGVEAMIAVSDAIDFNINFPKWTNKTNWMRYRKRIWQESLVTLSKPIPDAKKKH
nr:MAG TPA: Integrase [Caudoviricetes sp.]